MNTGLKCLLSIAFGAALSCPPARADRPLGPPQKHTVQSPDGRFEAVSDPATWTTTVFRVTQGGAKERAWAMVGWFRVLHLAADGEHLVIGYDGSNLLPVDVKDDEILLRFVRRGELLRCVTLQELVPDRSLLRRTVSHLLWRHASGFEPEGTFFVDTVDGWRQSFDVTTGQKIGKEVCPPPEPGSVATLTIETRMAPGDTYQTVLWHQGEEPVRAQVYHAYNAPTGDSVYRGDFNAILEAITGLEPKGPCRDVAEVLAAVQDFGWTLETETEEPGRSQVVVRTYRWEGGSVDR